MLHAEVGVFCMHQGEHRWLLWFALAISATWTIVGVKQALFGPLGNSPFT